MTVCSSFQNEMLGPGNIWEAKQRIAPFVLRTPLIFSSFLSRMTGAEVYLKLEILQEIGAFKIRGAANKILTLTPQERERGVATYSTGNHALAVASVSKKLGIHAIVCISNRVPREKIEAIENCGAQVQVIGSSQDDAHMFCRHLAEHEGKVIIEPFDDPMVIAGQGTIALEIMEELPDVDLLVVPTSGGGLIGGIALFLKNNRSNCAVVGVSIEHGAAMHASLNAGHPVQVKESDSLADSLLGGIGLDNVYTFSLVQRYVDDILLISEKEIARGMNALFYKHRLVTEGAAASGVGAMISDRLAKKMKARKAVVVITGNNVNMEAFKKVVCLEERGFSE